MDATALRIHARKDVANRAVLARRIESLKHEEERSARFGPQAGLEHAELGDELGQSSRAGLLVAEAQAVIRIAGREARRPSRSHTQLGEELGGLHHAGG